MREEILEQPDIVARLAADVSPYLEAAAAARAGGARFALYAARGTSDNACVFGGYLATLCGGLPAGLALPSTATIYRADVDYRSCVVIGISQSGETPDVAEFVARAREAGAFTIALTNHEDSLLARVADRAIATGAGEERSVPATKTYTSQLAALAMFWAAWSRDHMLMAALQSAAPAAMQAACGAEAQVQEIAKRLEGKDRLLVAARGYNYATALETALKLRETCYVAAMPFSTPDLAHGPMAMIEPGYPALIFAVPGKTFEVMCRLVDDLERRGAQVHVVSHVPVASPDQSVVLDALSEVPEALSPLVAVVPGQLLSLHLSLERGLDPDRPRGLSKITRY